MSLKSFHILLISLSVLLALVVGGWCSRAWLEGTGTLYLAMAIASFTGAVVLAVYVVWFARRMRTREEDDRQRRKLIRPLATVAALGLAGAEPSLACTVCYGEAAGPMIDAARLGVYLLFGLVLAVQLAFVAFFVHLWRRGRAVRALERGRPVPIELPGEVAP